MSIHNLTPEIDRNCCKEQEFIFNIILTDEIFQHIIAIAKNTQAYRIYRSDGTSVPKVTPGLMTELASFILRPCLRFGGTDSNKTASYRYLERRNNPPTKLAGYWESTDEEEIIIDRVADYIRRSLWNQGIDGVENPFKPSFISTTTRLLKRTQLLKIYPKHDMSKNVFNTQFGTYDAGTKKWRDADPDDEFLGICDSFLRLYTMADVERFAKEREAIAAHA